MAFPQLFSTKVAASNRSKFDLSCQHITTSDFGVMQASYCNQVVPGDTFDIRQQSFCRLAPLAFPTFGRADVESRAFYVPYRIVWAGTESFFTGKPYTDENGISHNLERVPHLTNEQFMTIFSDPAYGFCSVATSEGFDFALRRGDGSTDFFYWTSKGRRFYNLLIQLGYAFNFNTADKTPLSLLPYLCWSRIIVDWYLNPRFDYLHTLESIFKKFDSMSGSWSIIDVITLFDYNYKLYDSDYFNSSWQYPNDSGSVNRNENIVVVGNGGSGRTFQVSNNNQSTLLHRGDSNGALYDLSAASIALLQSLQRFVTRNNLVGTRYIDQMLARFGVRLTDAVVQRSQYIGSLSSPVQISDVMTTANTDSGSTGDFTGKGVSFGNGHYHIESKEYGMVIVVTTIVPKAGYYQGRKRFVTYKNRLDFYTPEFDCMNMQAIRNDELFADFTDGRTYAAAQSYGGRPDGIFGYVPRYSDCKIALDTLSGDFRIKSRNAQLSAFHLLRVLDEPSSSHPLANNSNFGMLTNSERANYDRIFQAGIGTDETQYDHFYLIHDFNVTAHRNMKSLSEAYEDEHEKGRDVSVRPNGVKF